MFNDDETNTGKVENPFGNNQLTTQRVSGALADAQSSRDVAEIQGMLILAKRFPRDQKAAVDRILITCARPSLAEKATYQYARGGTDITGPSIRLAEAIAQNWGNMLFGITELSRGAGQSECLAYAWDLETLVRSEKKFIVRHIRDTKGGGYALKDERDIYELIANMGARRQRACILAVIPGDVTELAVKQCHTTMVTKVTITPDLLKSLVEKFEVVGVSKKQIEARIQRSLDAITPVQVVNLGNIYNSLKDGMSEAVDWFEQEAETGIDKFKAAAEKKVPAPSDAAKMKDVPGVKEKTPPATASQAPTVVTLDSFTRLCESTNDLDVLTAHGKLIEQLPESAQDAASEVLDFNRSRILAGQ